MNGNIENTEKNIEIIEDKQRKPRVVISKLHSLPHPNAKFDQQLKMIKVYVIASNKGQKPVKTTDLTNMIDFSIGYVSGSNKFLEEIGLLERRGLGLYVPTQTAIDFYNSIEWRDDNKAKDILRNLIEKSWIWETTKQHLLINNGKSSIEDLIRRLGSDCQADMKLHRLCFNSIIEYLTYVNLVREDIDGTIIINETQSTNNATILKPENKLEIKETSIDIPKKQQEDSLIIESKKKEVKELDFLIYKSSGIELKLLPTIKNIEILKKFLDVISLEINETV